jgi:hypothetical protein
MFVKSPLKFKKKYGDLAEVATKRFRNASNYVRKNGVGSSIAFERFLPRDIALGRLFCGATSRRSLAFRATFSHYSSTVVGVLGVLYYNSYY